MFGWVMFWKKADKEDDLKINLKVNKEIVKLYDRPSITIQGLSSILTKKDTRKFNPVPLYLSLTTSTECIF
jgi:hypothetical protein